MSGLRTVFFFVSCAVKEWKNEVLILTFFSGKRLQEARDELDEFQEGSRELEAELEMQLEQAEARQRELLAAKTRLETENESLKVNGEYRLKFRRFFSPCCLS